MELCRSKEIKRIKEELIQLERDFEQRIKEGEYSALDYIPYDRLSFFYSQKQHTLHIMHENYCRKKEYLEKIIKMTDLEYTKMLLDEKDKEIEELKDNLDYHHINY